jgi:hypothetical protein
MLRDMNYCDDPAMVRVDFFKESGKWYTTEAIKWLHYRDMSIHEAFYLSLEASLEDRLSEMTAVCLAPYHEHAHPIMLKKWGSWTTK